MSIFNSGPKKKYLVKPDWLKQKIPYGKNYLKMHSLLKEKHINTVCVEAKCPNLGECFSAGNATFLILGKYCTRNCGFCGVKSLADNNKVMDSILNKEEHLEIAGSVKNMNLSYVVVTSVTRDDLPDGGAENFVKTIRAIRNLCSKTEIEVLIPDFMGNINSIKRVSLAGPDVLSHNIETVPRLYPYIRPGASFSGSLKLFSLVNKTNPDIQLKSGLILGLGEKDKEILQVLKELLNYGCRILTIGQYLRPGKDQVPVEKYILPEKFTEWKTKALEMGFLAVASGPFIRSSYKAGELYHF